ncbi:hypothetical protein ElyMa_006889900 [Elysia marginata]|uniref:Uncharacterized protein n=1 Tax=Elysia marginata TaxID=1093978 RepID=A0AAV4JB93_9GAST|nr:hypothetical protein ElyMa_006889900 [Elysia marginata]
MVKENYEIWTSATHPLIKLLVQLPNRHQKDDYTRLLSLPSSTGNEMFRRACCVYKLILVPGQVLLKVSGANPRSLHSLLNIPPEPLDPLRVNLRFARFDEVLFVVNRVVTVPEFAELMISRPGIRVDDAAGPNKLLDDRNERLGVPPRSVLTV